MVHQHHTLKFTQNVLASSLRGTPPDHPLAGLWGRNMEGGPDGKGKDGIVGREGRGNLEGKEGGSKVERRTFIVKSGVCCCCCCCCSNQRATNGNWRLLLVVVLNEAGLVVLHGQTFIHSLIHSVDVHTAPVGEVTHLEMFLPFSATSSRTTRG